MDSSSYQSIDEDLFLLPSHVTSPNSTLIFTSTVASSTDSSEGVYGDILYAIASPILMTLGLLGNLLSLIIFMFGSRSSKVARSQYLIAISVSDSVVLLSYVLPEWVKRGLPTLDSDMIVHSGLVYDSWRCHTILFFSYSSRFISAWLRVLFTFERFYSIRFPFKRLTFATKLTRIFILTTFACGFLISSVKPIIMREKVPYDFDALTSESTTVRDLDIASLLTSPSSLSSSDEDIFVSDSSFTTTDYSMNTTDEPFVSSTLPTGWGSDFGNLSFTQTESFLNEQGIATTMLDSNMIQAIVSLFVPGKNEVS